MNFLAAVSSTISCFRPGICTEVLEHMQDWAWSTREEAGGGCSRKVWQADCDLIVKVGHQSVQYASQLLAVGRAAMLYESDQYACLQVMGCRTQPFVATQGGFKVTIGAKRNPEQACWRAYEIGFCARGEWCKWQ